MQSRRQPLASTPEDPGAPKVRRAAEQIKDPFKASNNTGWKGVDSGSAVTSSPAAEVKLWGACLSTHHGLRQMDWRDQQYLSA